MNKPLADSTEPVEWSRAVFYVLRGTASFLCAAGFCYVAWCSSAEAYQFDVDGEVEVGYVVSTSQQTRPKQSPRGHSTTYYLLIVASRHGPLSFSSDVPISVGNNVRYIYSPALKKARLAPGELKRGGMLWAELFSGTSVVFLTIVLLLTYYAYHQYWWAYAYTFAHPRHGNRH